MNGPSASHVPVLLERVLELLAPSFAHDRPAVVDATLGLGGHAEAMLTRFDDLHVIGIDRDPEALARAGRRLEPFGDRVTLAHAVYDEVADVVRDAGFEAVSGVLFDLGVSSMQLDLTERGFAYSQDAPLDMRMNPGDGADRRRRPQHVHRRRSRAGAAGVRRGAFCPSHRTGRRRGPRR